MTHREDKIRSIMLSPDRKSEIEGMTPLERDDYFMSIAMEIARSSALDGEVPVGAVCVRDGAIISCGGNGREGEKNALSHAEINAIDLSCKALGGWRLVGVTLYVTLEPCPMCAGAIINSRIPRVVFAAKDARAGAMGSIIKMQALPLGYSPAVEINEKYQKESVALLRDFFRSRRNAEKQKEV